MPGYCSCQHGSICYRSCQFTSPKARLRRFRKKGHKVSIKMLGCFGRTCVDEEQHIREILLPLQTLLFISYCPKSLFEIQATRQSTKNMYL